MQKVPIHYHTKYWYSEHHAVFAPSVPRISSESLLSSGTSENPNEREFITIEYVRKHSVPSSHVDHHNNVTNTRRYEESGKRSTIAGKHEQSWKMNIFGKYIGKSNCDYPCRTNAFSRNVIRALAFLIDHSNPSKIKSRTVDPQVLPNKVH